MVRENHPRFRQIRKIRRKQGNRATYQRILIVCEGTKTEPQYFDEIKAAERLSNANIRIVPGGVDPLSLAQYAEDLFTKGDQKTARRSFDEVYVVFDRDDHGQYHNALAKIEALHRKYQNDDKQYVTFSAVTSVPCFELWLLIHYESILAPIHRNEVFKRLKIHLPRYEKGGTGIFAATKLYLDIAFQCAQAMSGLRNAHDDAGPYTGVHELVNTLLTIKGS